MGSEARKEKRGRKRVRREYRRRGTGKKDLWLG